MNTGRLDVAAKFTALRLNAFIFMSIDFNLQPIMQNCTFQTRVSLVI